jgi:hypothetical protein
LVAERSSAASSIGFAMGVAIGMALCTVVNWATAACWALLCALRAPWNVAALRS